MPGAAIEEIIAALVVKYTVISSIEKDFFGRQKGTSSKKGLASQPPFNESVPFTR
jgi:hypothetical protein